MAKKKGSRSPRQRIVAIVALALAGLLLATTLFYYISSALAENEIPADRYVLEMELTEDLQALRIRQRLVFHNRAGVALDALEFCLAPNVFRRESSLFYDNASLQAAFPAGYSPGGIEFGSITVDGNAVDWGLVGDDELYLRVYRPLQPGGRCEIEFVYALLLTRNGAFSGYDATDVRLSAFYPTACVYDPGESAFIRTAPLSFTRWQYAPRGDYEAVVTLPRQYVLVAAGSENAMENGNGTITWTIRGENLQDLALCLSRVWRQRQRQAGGVNIRTFANLRGAADRVLDIAAEAVAACEDWFGPFPVSELDIVQSGYALGALDFQGMVWVSESLLAGDRDALRHALYRSVVRQYFGLAVRAEPVADAWLSDAVCEYAAYLLLERARGTDAMLARLRRELLPSLGITIPGSLYVTSDASLFQERPDEYAIVVVDQGAAVLHQLRSAMGRERFLQGLRNFYTAGLATDVLTEMDFLAAMDATGGSWNDFLVDWIFHLSEYTRNTADWFREE